MKVKVLADKVVDELVKEVAGPDVIPLVQLIKDKENISEFKLADKMKITVNQVRNMLYRLSDKNLVSFIRKKDKKKGWYIYYWTFDSKRALELIFELKRKKVNQLREELAKERGENFFSCPNKCVRLNYVDALEIQYKCPECGQILMQVDNTRKIERMEAEIKELEKEVAGEGIFEEKVIRKPKPKKKPKVKKKPKKRKLKKKPKKIKKRKKAKKKIVKKRVAKKVKPKKRIKKKPKKIKKLKPKKPAKKKVIKEKPKRRRLIRRIFRKGTRILRRRKI